MSEELEYNVKVCMPRTGTIIIDAEVNRMGMEAILKEMSTLDEEEQDDFVYDVMENGDEEEFRIVGDKYEIAATRTSF